MRKIHLSLLALAIAFACHSQNVIVNPGAGSYPALKDAFDAINVGTHTGTITIDIINSTTEPAGGAILNASGSGAASYTSILIQPSGGAAMIITGAATDGLPLIDLNGADNVTINGLNTGGNSLTIANTTVSATAGTSTVRFINGATNNTITNCIIQGSGTMAVATNGAVIFFSNDAVTVTGNDNNTISNNNIGPAGANLPTKAILGNGTVTTTAIGNSGITITNNDIHDFFGASVTSSGIAINGGCNTWAITNNRFYQTGTRTWTTGAIHRAIDLNNTTTTSGLQGMTVTGNIIGYASNTQTGTYTLTGSSGKFHAIQFNGITGGIISNINNNTVASVSMTGVTSSGTSTSSPFIVMLISNGMVNTNNNTIGSQSATGSLTFSTTTTAATDIIGIYNFSVNTWVATGNTVGGISVTNAGASGTFVISGMRATTGATLSATLTSNTIGGTIANSIQLTATGAASQVIGLHANNSAAIFSSNTIRNLTSNIGTGTTASASVIGINITVATAIHNLSQNTIFNLSNTHATAATVVTGIQFTGAAGNTVQRNLIYDLTVATNSTAAEVNGIRVAAGTTIYRNNMIRLGAGISNAIGAGPSTGLNGINEPPGGFNSFYHNSIYIGGAPTAGTGPSCAFNSTLTTNARAVRNNIFVNARSNSGATGKNYIIRITGITGLTINNNIYFASGTGSVFGFFIADMANLAAWKSALGQDAASAEADPQYNGPTNATPDLHLHPTNPSPAESGGFDVGVTDDYDGQTRSGLTPVDIGADAGNYVALDIFGPAITYNLPGNTSLTTNRLVTVTIVDYAGVATGVGDPRIYFNKNGGAYSSTALSLTSGTVNNGVWTATIDYSLVGGVVFADVIRYFVIAQDINGYVSVNPSAGHVAADVNTVTTPPTTPGSYTITTSFSGSYNVGAGETYTSLTNAGGIFEAFNSGAFTGNITINITSDLTGETGTHALNQWPEDGAGNYTLLIRPTASRIISGNNASALIKLNGADRVVIDGSVSGATVNSCAVGGEASIRQLTIQNTNTGTSVVVIAIQSGTNGAVNNILKNVIVSGNDPATTLLGISMGGAPGNVGTDNDNNTIENCAIRRAMYGIYSAGTGAANQNANTVITHNDISSTGIDRVQRIGIVMFNENNARIDYNSLAMETSGAFDVIGIGFGIQAIDNAYISANPVTNSLISNNKINGIVSLNATGFSAVGIAVAGATGGANTIRNNMITGVRAPSTGVELVAGIFVAGVAGSATNVYHNSVSMTGDRGVVGSQSPGFGLAITGNDPVVDIKNNIFHTTQTSGGGVNARSYAIGTNSTSFSNMSSDYNNFWSTGANDGGLRTGSLAPAAGTDYATVALFAATTATDANSSEVLTPFVNDLNDLHLQASASCVAIGKGINLPSVTTDFDCNSRNTLPFKGAHEGYEPATAATGLFNSAPGTANRTYLVNGTTDYMKDCELIARITPSGAMPVAGQVLAKVTLDASVQTYNGSPYVQRHFDIEPQIGSAGATATVTLFASQAEFDNYNLANGSKPDLPTGPGDNAGIANVLVTQFHGTGTAPGNYTGAAQLINPDDVNIIWNGTSNWWEISFAVTGFSGFYIHTNIPLVTLPAGLLSFSGKKEGTVNRLRWTTGSEQNNRGFEVQRAVDGNNFTTIGFVNSNAVNGNSSSELEYSFADNNPPGTWQYYRLRQVDIDNHGKLSTVVLIRGDSPSALAIGALFPNPASNQINVLIDAPVKQKLSLVILDATGRQLMQRPANVEPGSNTVPVNISALTSGTYMIKIVCADNCVNTMSKFIKK